MSELTDSIETNAAQPKKMSVDGVSAEQHSIKDQIEADRYLKSETGAVGKKRGINLARFRHNGTV